MGTAADFERHEVCATHYPLVVGSVHGVDAPSIPIISELKKRINE
jgi:hypothetical protein